MILYLLFIGVFRSNFVGMFSSTNIGGGDRFFFIPMMFILILFIRHIETFNNNILKYIIYVCIISISFNLVLNYEIQPFEDLKFKSYAEDFNINGQFSCTVPINPQNYFLKIPCKNQSSFYDKSDWNLIKRIDGGMMHIDTINMKKYYLDSIVNINAEKTQIVDIKGWAVDDQSKNGNVNTYIIFSHHEDINILPTNKLLRPDIAGAFGVDNYIQSGWSTNLMTKDLKKQCYNISVRILRRNGKEYYELGAEKPLCII